MKDRALKEVRAALKPLGIVVSDNDVWEEYRVNFVHDGHEATAYHTGDLADAADTGKAMAASRV